MKRTAPLMFGLCALGLLCSCDNASTSKPASSAKPAASTSAAAKPKASAKTAASATPTASASASAEAALPRHIDGAVIEPAEGAGEPPSSSDWESAAEVTVTGSTRAGCMTKVHKGWFLARCQSDKDGLGRLKSAQVIKGLRPKQTQINESTIGKDGAGKPLLAYDIITPYVQGTDFVVNLQWIKGHNLDLSVQWPKDQASAPQRTGIVQQAPNRDAK